MKLTNKYGLPRSIVNAVGRDPYSNKGTLSVTTLIKPPQMVYLERKHFDEIEEDVSDKIWSLLGQSVHHILERAVDEGDTSEQRLYAEIGGVKVSGQFDLFTREAALQDFKVTSVWAVKDALKQGKDEWSQQLNLLATLARINGLTPARLQIVAICKDWRRIEMMRYDDYPKKVEVIDIPMWLPEKSLEFMKERIALHQDAQNGHVCLCTPEERWYTGDKYAVMKKGRKSALRLLDSKLKAMGWCFDNGHFHQMYKDGEEMPDQILDCVLTAGITIEHRPGKYNRCDYCSASQFCKQYMTA